MKKIELNFMGARKVTTVISILLIIFSIISLARQGLNLGIDFFRTGKRRATPNRFPSSGLDSSIAVLTRISISPCVIGEATP